MNLHLIRLPTDEGKTFGSLSIDGVFQCYTLEDAVRDVKVPRETAIPAGRYRVRLTLSNRFQKVLPLLYDVPWFAGVRIHAGNFVTDTEGCILVGRSKTPSGVAQSKFAMADLMQELEKATAVGEEIWITVEDAAAQEPAA